MVQDTTTMEKTKLERVLEGAPFTYFTDRMERRYRVKRRGFFDELQRRDSGGEWQYEGTVQTPSTGAARPRGNRLHVTGHLAGQYVETRIDLDTVFLASEEPPTKS